MRKPEFKKTILKILVLLLILIFASPFSPLFVIPLSVLANTLFSPAPPPPEIKQAEFDFRLEYEVEGERHIYEDVLICEYGGYDFNASIGKYRTWNDHFKSTGNDSGITLYQISDTKSIYFLTHHSLDEYLMGDPDIYNAPRPEYFIGVSDSQSDVSLYGTSEEDALFEECGFQVIDWYCDPPIQNTFK